MKCIRVELSRRRHTVVRFICHSTYFVHHYGLHLIMLSLLSRRLDRSEFYYRWMKIKWLSMGKTCIINHNFEIKQVTSIRISMGDILVSESHKGTSQLLHPCLKALAIYMQSNFIKIRPILNNNYSTSNMPVCLNVVNIRSQHRWLRTITPFQNLRLI